MRYGSVSSRAAGQLSYTVLQQLDRPNRFATLEVWELRDRLQRVADRP